MNILFTCAGRRNYLLRYFREELQSKGKIYAADMNSTAPALQEADHWFVVPALTDDAYIPTIVKICEQENISLVISLNDVELPLLAKYRSEFRRAGAELLISSEEVVDICFDKLKTIDFLEKNELLSPRTFCDLQAAKSVLTGGEVGLPRVEQLC